MTATLNDVPKRQPVDESAEQNAAWQPVRLAREQGLALTGPDSVLKQLNKAVIKTALNEEVIEHVRYEMHDPAGREAGICVTTADRSRC